MSKSLNILLSNLLSELLSKLLSNYSVTYSVKSNCYLYFLLTDPIEQLLVTRYLLPSNEKNITIGFYDPSRAVHYSIFGKITKI